MAELLLKPGSSGRTAVAPRIDLTPMVDLGFLLLTFFMTTTTMSRPKAMDVQMPYDGPEPSTTAFYESSAITLMPASRHAVYYYEGLFDPAVPLKKAASVEALRKVLHDKAQLLRQRARPEERKLQVLIKAHPDAKAADIIGLLDEMSIEAVPVYAMVDLTPGETAVINRQEGSATP